MVKFKDYPDFQPNLTPKQMFEIGIMGGFYFRTIISPTGKRYVKRYERYDFLKSIPLEKYAKETYDKNINRYKKKVGTSYDFWNEKGWIKEDVDPFGWIEWYCNFWMGRRSYDDKRQIERWKRLAGVNGRFRKQLQNKINEIGNNDDNVFIGIRQTLLHWGFDSRKMSVQKKLKTT